MDNVKIVEYDPSYAKAVADMWNQSSGGWNGLTTYRTTEMVLREHENAFHLNVFLAVKDDEVIGYCSLDKYFKDNGALYVAVLNVRPDFHGKKIGKMLVLASVDKTIELGWPRLDLFTWPGNTKAVPLYKKCGFFWEDRDDITHLMNFIPTVLDTEILKGYFEYAHWYEDSKRHIEIKPDGIKDNKFDYFTYLWEKDGKKLRVEFERTGRGMRLIETDDFLISAVVEDHELVFGRNYRVRYEIENKSGKPLNIEINGINDRNIKFDCSSSINVTGKDLVEGVFCVEEIQEDQNPHMTHPGVAADILINGKKARFKVGVLPAYPSQIKLFVPGEECYRSVKSVCYMEIENKFKEDAVFEIELPQAEGICFEKTKYTIELNGGERDTVEIPYILEDFIYYSASVRVNAILKSGEAVSFDKHISAAFRGRSGLLWGENKEACEIFNGSYSVNLNKLQNNIIAGRIYGDWAPVIWMFPKVGRPYSPELSKRKPDDTICCRDGEDVLLKAVYNLRDLEGLSLISITRLGMGGIVRHHYEITNISSEETEQDIWVSDTFRFNLHNGVIPYTGSFIRTDKTAECAPDKWDSEKVTENWLFTYGINMTCGITWHTDDKIKFDNWAMYFEHNFGRLKAGETKKTNPITAVMDAFGRWQDFRKFALKKTADERPAEEEYLSLGVNSGNPFVDRDFIINVNDRRTGCLRGKINFTSKNEIFDNKAFIISPSEQDSGIEYKINPGREAESDVITMELDTGAFEVKRKTAVFFKKPLDVRLKNSIESSKKILTADNGKINIKVCPEYSYTVFSMKYNDNEWLDSCFPDYEKKSWWNPWMGGINMFISGMSTASQLKEKRTGSFIELCDCKGNNWKGIKTEIIVEKNEPYKGLKMEFYYLLLPGTSVLCYMTGIRQETGRFLKGAGLESECFINPGGDLSGSWVEFADENGEMTRLKAGLEQHFISSNSTFMFASNSRRERMLLFAGKDKVKITAGANNKLIMSGSSYHTQIKKGERLLTPPVFIIFNEEYIDACALKELGKLEFKPGE